MKRRLFVDLDGVLADFDTHHERMLGRRTNKLNDDVDWNAVRRIPNFYAGIPLMRDAAELWRACAPYDPTILSGIPASIGEAEANKRAWVRAHLGDDVPVVCCRAKDKYLHGRPGDVLVDDWAKHRGAWENMGGTFLLHVDAITTIPLLRNIMDS